MNCWRTGILEKDAAQFRGMRARHLFEKLAPRAPNSPQKTNPCWDSLKPEVWFPCICLGLFFTFCHGKSSLNQHMFFPTQANLSFLSASLLREALLRMYWLVTSFLLVVSLPKIIIKVAELSPVHFPKQAATDGTYRSKYWLLGFGFDSRPNLQP